MHYRDVVKQLCNDIELNTSFKC